MTPSPSTRSRAPFVATHPEGTELERTFLTLYRQLTQGLSMPPMKREYHFTEERDFRFDFAWPSVKVAVECEGYDHLKHKTYYKDIVKYNEAAVREWYVLRCTTSVLRDCPDWFVNLLVRAIANRL